MRNAILHSMVLGIALVSGCEKESAPPTPAARKPDSAAKATGEAARNAANKAGDTAAGAADATAKQAETAADSARDAAKDASASADSNENVAQAQKLLDDAMTYIKDNKLDLAEQALTKLEGMKASLPAEWAPRIDQARSALAAAKATGGGNGAMPKLPGT